MTDGINLGLVGATGNVGQVMASVLAERGVRVKTIRAFASVRSAGSTLHILGRDVVVESLAGADPTGLDVALFSAGADRSREHAPRFAAAGCTVIDNSSAFRMDESTPLVVPEVNARVIGSHKGIIANPNCSTIQLVCALNPIANALGLDHVHVTTFQSVSGTGRDAMVELREQSRVLLDSGSAAAVVGPDQQSVTPGIYAKPIAFNALPHCDSFDEEGITKEERKLMDESRKILELPGLRLGATCVRVPVFVAHSEAVHFTTSHPSAPAEIRSLLASAPGVEVVDDPADNVYPTALDAAGRDEVLVGRIRRDPSRENGFAMFVVADNLRKGAATNAVQILELL